MADVSKLPLAETVFDDDQGSTPPRRDRIVILGRRASGKTVYLSVLYEKFWKSLDSLTLKAVSGNTHSDLVRVVEGLREGRWPAATLETQYCDLEVKYKGRKHLMVTLDYAGELFRRAFVEDITDTPETAALVEHIDAAAAVILLIDPASLVGDNSDARIDDDFGMTQAVTRIRNWPGGRGGWRDGSAEQAFLFTLLSRCRLACNWKNRSNNADVRRTNLWSLHKVAKAASIFD
ncbi:MAG: hypothetical protein IID37_14380 [Planctomycetes bacterium]|nr:hypothetical protein [Planctomycetota bacterium]